MSSILPSLVVGAVTAIFSVWLALRRFHAERWWERKADAYSRIVEALHDAMEYCSTQSDESMTGKEMSEEREKELRENYERAYRELKKATSIGAYIISDEVAQVLASLEKRPRSDPEKCARFEIFDAEHEAYKKALKEVRTLAKRDMRVAMRIPQIRISGWQRLGIALSACWLLFVPFFYFIGIVTSPSPIASAFRQFYIWVPGSRPAGPGEVSHDIGFIPDVPRADGFALAFLSITPLLVGWFILYVLPRSVGWIRDGFHTTGKPPNC